MLSVVYACVLWMHPIHISVSEISYSEKDRALQITSRIFIDDLELAIRAQRKQEELDITKPPAGITTEQLVGQYLTQHFRLKVDGKPVTYTLLGIETEDLAFVCYLEVENIRKMKTLEVLNDVIMEIHDDQSNLVHVTYKSPVKSARLVRGKASEVFIFDTKK